MPFHVTATRAANEHVLVPHATRWQDEIAARVTRYRLADRLYEQEFGNIVRAGESVQPGFLQVSRHIRSEVLPMYYNLNKFGIFAVVQQLSKVQGWLKLISERYVSHQEMYAKLKLQIPYRELTWHSIGQLLPLASTAMNHPDLERFPKYSRSIQNEVFQLGQLRAKEGWSEEWLKVRFDEWLRELHGYRDMRRALCRRKGQLEFAALQRGSAEPVLPVRDPTIARPTGDMYATQDHKNPDKAFKAKRGHLPSSDRELRSMSTE